MSTNPGTTARPPAYALVVGGRGLGAATDPDHPAALDDEGGVLGSPSGPCPGAGSLVTRTPMWSTRSELTAMTARSDAARAA